MKLQCLYADGFLPACGVDASGAAGIQTLREKGWLLVLIEIASLEYLSREAPPDKYDGQRLLRSAKVLVSRIREISSNPSELLSC